MCELLTLTVSAYKYYLKYGSKKYDEDITKVVISMSEKYPTYGYHRLTIAIERETGIHLNRKTVYRYRQYLGIKAIQPKKRATIPSGIEVSKIAPNIVNREFNPEAKNRIWSIDITYVPQGDGTKSYLFAIKDLYDKSIIDYEVSKTMSVSFVIKCLNRAISNNDTSKVMIHSDQGVHFTCDIYINLLESNNITISHSRKGNCHDNAPIESFFALYKKEALWIVKPRNYTEAKNQIDDYMLYYNQQRIQIGLNGKTPSEFRLSA